MRQSLRRRRRSSGEHPAAAQPVTHPVHGLALLEEARPATIVATAPAPHPRVLTGSFLELEAVERSLAEYLIVGHEAIVSRGCDTVERHTSLPDVELNDRELALVLAGLFELRITHLEDDALWSEIAAVAEKLGGDVGAMFFGTSLR